MGASEQGWRAWRLRERDDGVGVSVRECEGPGGLEGSRNGVPRAKTGWLSSATRYCGKGALFLEGLGRRGMGRGTKR